ncbi:heterokaryon incompatibility protein-domain-containing protein [Hypoxylon trugodes]|uniref:heterokaryon incompatibility protein-domain-containing protein n=1 Tax=Hypoxylon trugodes TaxID=326681 RepID=UPI00219C9315|nr:heterokaryon incompatibility protein-domain-containing protein [Hypoxylon trugodes]KAI1394385.1 heterokaryon incompatibility protein-domain-containing protein [Hypoxylon trugodes]
MAFSFRNEFSRDGLCAVRKDMDRQPKCNGCRRVESLIRYCERYLTAGSKPKPVLFHNSYRELEFCAEKCSTCRVIRRGFLLNQATFTQAEMLGLREHQVPLWATIEDGKLGASLQKHADSLVLGGNRIDLQMGSFGGIDERSLPAIASDNSVCAEIRTWARGCQTSHPDCGNLNWSRRNPTRLICILSDSLVQIVETRHMEFLEYVSLSYCWGSNQEIGNKPIPETRTVRANIAQRRRPFPITDLRRTIQDVIRFIKGVGIQFVWIDSVCIIQDSAEDWATEASLMAGVYSNAHFTLCSVAVENADTALIRPREAWKHPIEPNCQLAGQHLSAVSPPLHELKRQAPYSARAWILQEEKLSPRILYWTPQRMYWSCATQRSVECAQFQMQRRQPDAFNDYNPTQAFLRASRDGTDLHLHWKDLVEDYTKRLLTKSSDRFPALSGVAAKYQLARSDDEYLAGLWRRTIDEDLAWRVESPAPPNRLRGRIEGIPSWSWASLPVATPANMSRNWIPCDSFVFMGSQIPDQRLDILQKMDASALTDQSTHKVQKGAGITSIKVRSRMRPLLRASSERRPWSDVKSRDGRDGKFEFARFVDRNIHCVEPDKGLLLLYESQRQEIVYQLDYLSDTSEVLSRINQLECIELGRQAMLLVESCGYVANDSAKSYRRLGVSLGPARSDFFNNAPIETCNLI